MENSRANSENRMWDENHHPWDRLDSSFLSTHSRFISNTERVHATDPAQLSTNIGGETYMFKNTEDADLKKVYGIS